MSKLFTKEACKEIEKAIEVAEMLCSGEIRVHVDRHCKPNVLDSASETFARLEMHKTALRNGILFYFATEDKRFAVIGDVGINSKVSQDFWDDIIALIRQGFADGNFIDALCQSIRLCGAKLAEFFPYQEDDVNELPNDVSFGK